MLKKLGYSIMIGLLACSFFAGCGGGDKGGTTTTKTTSTAKKADAELKFGSYTAKLYKVENSAQLFIANRNNRPKRVSIYGKNLYAMTDQRYLAKLVIDANKKNISMDNPALVSDLWENAQICANDYGVYFNKKTRPYFLSHTGNKEILVDNKSGHVESIDNGRSGYRYMNQGEVHKVELKNTGVISKSLGVVRPAYTARRGGKDPIGAGVAILSDRDGFYAFGDGSSSGRMVGRGVYYDKNNKLTAFYGSDYKNDPAAVQDKGYITQAGDAVVTDRYFLICDKAKGTVNQFDKKTGRFNGSLSFSEIGGPDTKYISMAHIEYNKVLIVAGNANDKNKLDRLWILEM